MKVSAVSEVVIHPWARFRFIFSLTLPFLAAFPVAFQYYPNQNTYNCYKDWGQGRKAFHDLEFNLEGCTFPYTDSFFPKKKENGDWLEGDKQKGVEQNMQ